MKEFKTILILLLSLTGINQISAQDYTYIAEPLKTDEEMLEMQLKSGNIELYKTENFPFDKIYNTNPKIKSLTISHSKKLITLSENVKKLEYLNEIDISGVGLREFPIGFCYIKNLEHLRYVNNPTTFIPKDIGKLNLLKTLKFRTLPIKEIPKEIGKLINLEELEIGGTASENRTIIADSIYNLTGIKNIPKEIGKLKVLKRLSLYSNNLFEIPSEIGLLDNLTYLSLENNNLKLLPIEIYNLRNLEALKLSNNPIEELPEEIGNLTNLKILELSNLKLKSLPKSIENLKKLERLYLHFNNISETELIELKKKLPKTMIVN